MAKAQIWSMDVAIVATITSMFVNENRSRHPEARSSTSLKLERRRMKFSGSTLGDEDHTKKGQIWSLDFVFASILLAFLLLMFLTSWNELSIRWNNSEEYRELKIAALYAADSLLTTSGEPKSWENLNSSDALNYISAIGLVNERARLNNKKLDALKQLEGNYSTIKARLGLSKYDVQLLIVNGINDSIVYYDFGQNLTGFNSAAIIERPVLLNDSIHRAKIIVWKNQSSD